MAEARALGRPAPAVPDRVGTPMPILPGPFGAMRGWIQSIASDIWFTPGQPVAPQAPPSTEPRSLDYPVGINIMYVPRSEEDITFAQLRSLSDLWDLLRIAIESKKSQISGIEWTIRPVKQFGESTSDYKKRTKKDTKAENIRQIFLRPDGYHPFSVWIRTVLEDAIVLDAMCLIKGTRNGRPTFEYIDGATIKRLIDNKGRTPEADDGAAYQQVIKGVPALNFTVDELFYFQRNIRSHKLYGMSPVEQIVWTINLAIRRQLYKLAYYTEGNMPEAFIQLPAEWGIDQVKQYSDWFNSLLAGQVDVRRKAFFVPAGASAGNSIVFPKQDALKDEMDEWLARVVRDSLDLSPQPYVREMNRATAQTGQEAARTEGIVPWTKYLADSFTDLIQLESGLGEKDYEFAFSDEQEFDQLKKAQRQALEVRNGIKSPDEVRDENGDEAIGVGPGIVTATGFVELETARDMAEATLERASQPADGTQQNGDGTGSPTGSGQQGAAAADGGSGSGGAGAQIQKVTAADAWATDRGKRRLVRTNALLERFLASQRLKIAKQLGEAYDAQRTALMSFTHDVEV